MPKPWWKKKAFRVTVIIVVILAGLVVLTDRIAASIAENKVATLIAKEAGNQKIELKSEPDVDVTGFPFLTQVLGGNYDRIDIGFKDLTASGVTLPRLDVHASNVDAPLSQVLKGQGPITAGSMTAEAKLDYKTVTELMGETTSNLRIEGVGGKLKITATLEAAGVSVSLEGTGTVQVSKDAVSVTVDQLRPVGGSPIPGADGMINAFAQKLNKEIPLPPLPYDLALNDVKVETDAIVVSATASGVQLV
ncbi:hypothetical protein Afil01_22360 [Actinorhabdospora filicis]|uniref:DUF2993 domain-containing protein n=1 Tax=Actinorhabdospora filicis TaxID=1785913 RepID=A0A9W6SHX0_9ACTN|nr:DUF2993 domain-containing protein [Actinorhabdospora filicis]GLZ77429.1 hypothetical protein Afil01_22360 [Actinorhabdospora filicis]